MEAFRIFLVDNGAPATHAGRIARAIAARVATAGIKLNVSISESIVQSSRMTDDHVAAFIAREFTGVLEHDFTVVLPDGKSSSLGFGSPGKPAAGVAKLREAGIDCTDALFGTLLAKFDGPITPASSTKLDEFYTELGKLGVGHGSKATIVEALKRQLDVGLDRVTAAAPARLPPTEEGEEPPRTPPRPTQPSAASPHTQPGARQRAPVAPTPPVPPMPAPAPAPAPAPNSYMQAALAVVAVGVAFYWASILFAAPSDAVALR